MTHAAAGLNPMDVAAILIVLATVSAYINHRLFRMPFTVGLTVMGAAVSLLVLGLDRGFPQLGLGQSVIGFVRGINFSTALMNGMLSFLLFAGALHVDWAAMRRGRLAILLLSTGGTFASTALIGLGFAGLTALAGIPVPLVWCLVFGALISPTDPVSVMQVLKRIDVPPTLEATVAGESLFNDGVGVVIFTILLAAAVNGVKFDLGQATLLFAIEAGGGALLGLALGWVAIRAMRAIDAYNLEVLITLSLVMGGYAIAQPLHVSGPVAMAVAGLMIGNHGVTSAMSPATRDHVLNFWTLVDEILNAVLFLLIGLQVLIIPFDPRLILIGLASIGLALVVRSLTVAAPLIALRPLLSLGRLAPLTLIWGGLRGGISVALALGLPSGPFTPSILAATYIVVLFTVVVQGGTIGALLKRASSKTAAAVP
jgi:CPA1 family monovalent cation:H+ antiporter